MPYKNPEERKAQTKRYYQANKDKIKSYSKENSHKYLDKKRESSRNFKYKDPIGYILSRAKRRAKEKGFDFNLTREDISIPQECPFFNIPLFYTDNDRTDNTPSLDRIDNSKGYIKGNVSVISFIANRVKNSLTIELAKKFVTYMETGELPK